MRSWKECTRRSLFFLKIWKNERGQDLIEYAMIAAFIAIVSGMFMPTFAQDVSTMYSKISSAVKVSFVTGQTTL
jgi:Flp pilus assembly pilin Flp